MQGSSSCKSERSHDQDQDHKIQCDPYTSGTGNKIFTSEVAVEINRGALAAADAAEVAGAGEEAAAIFVEADSHHFVGHHEGLLHAVAMVDVYVDVEHARVVLQQLQNRQHYVVHVAETARLDACAQSKFMQVQKCTQHAQNRACQIMCLSGNLFSASKRDLRHAGI